MTKASLRNARWLLALGIGAIVAGCGGTTSLGSLTARTQLRDVTAQTVPVAYRKVAIVAVEAPEEARRTLEAAFAGQLGARGVETVSGASLAPATGAADGITMLEAARKAGAQALLFVTVPGGSPMPPGRAAARYLGSTTDNYVALPLERGQYGVSDARLYDLGSNRQVWSGSAVVAYPRQSAEDATLVAQAVVADLAQRKIVQ